MVRIDYITMQSAQKEREFYRERVWTESEVDVHFHCFFAAKDWQKNKKTVKGYQKQLPVFFRSFAKMGQPLFADRESQNWISELMSEKKGRFYEKVSWRTPVIPGALAGWLWQELPFAEQVIVLAGAEEEMGSLSWQRQLLEDHFQNLNALWIIGAKRQADFYQEIYERSGLPVINCEVLPPVPDRKSLVLDFTSTAGLKPEGSPQGQGVGIRIPWRNLPRECLYADMTSDEEKRRLLSLKRADISYLSGRVCLDTALKKRYNAICL